MDYKYYVEYLEYYGYRVFSGLTNNKYSHHKDNPAPISIVYGRDRYVELLDNPYNYIILNDSNKIYFNDLDELIDFLYELDIYPDYKKEELNYIV